jgi:hypothetical protein
VTEPLGGRLSRHLAAWEEFPCNTFVKEVLQQGHSLPFLSNPPTFRGVRETPLSGDYASVLPDEVASLLAKGAVEEVSQEEAYQGWYGHYFLVKKKSGGLRPILNLKPLNKLLQVEKFKMESLKSVILATQPGEWLASVDLKDAYFHVSIRESHRKFLRFALQGKRYQYRVLPFGLSTSPRVFTKVLAPVMAALRTEGIHIHPYLDDILIRAQGPAELRSSVQRTLQLLFRTGYVINQEKSQLLPTQDLVYIGGRLRPDLGQVFLPEDRKKALIRLVQSFPVGSYRTAKAWLSLMGVMAATISVVPYARLRMRPVQMWFLSKWSHRRPMELKVLVPFKLAPHLQWWATSHNLSQGLPLSPQHHDHVITTDASGSGWGGVLDDAWTAKGLWSGDRLLWHINRQELMAVELTLKEFRSCLAHKLVLVRSDNTTTCAYVNKQGGTHSPALCRQTWEMFLWCMEHHITLRAVYIPGVENVHADSLSREKDLVEGPLGYRVDQREWSLEPEVLSSVFVRLGEPQIDLFASRSNAKLRLFCALHADQGEMVVDGLSFTWRNVYGYAFPPPVLIARVLDKLIRDQASLILIAPAWPDRPWYSTLLHCLVEVPLRLPARQDLLSQLGQYHPDPGFFKLTAWKVSGRTSETRAFRKGLSKLQRKLEDPQRKLRTKPTGDSSSVGAVKGISIPLLPL